MAKRNHKPESRSAAKLNAKSKLNTKADKKLNKKPDNKTSFPYQRQLKVRQSYYDYHHADFTTYKNPYPQPVPWVNIKGYWLNQAGFPIGTELEVTVKRGQIILSALPAG